jgi:hypothetical protein
MKTSIPPVLITFAVLCFTLSPAAQAVSPAPDGGYPGANTAEGENALLSLTTGRFNTVVGWLSLHSLTTGNFNTAVGAGTLTLNEADGNTAVGAGALLFNTTGKGNTANGAFALFNNTEADGNTAVGAGTLFFNTVGSGNTAVGTGALHRNAGGPSTSSLNTAVGLDALTENTTGNGNTAVGAGGEGPVGPAALGSNTTGDGNTAVGATMGLGAAALGSNTTGNGNTAVGAGTVIGAAALGKNTTGEGNTAIGQSALNSNTTGSENTAVGVHAGDNVTTANHVICIGSDGADVSNTTWIGNVYGVTTQSGTTAPVIVSDTGQLGTVASSERFKKDIATMEKASEAILLLRPVTFHYKTDTKGTPQFGLIAEEVAKVNPALVLPDKEGKPYTVRYDAVNAMLLNEFLKEHRKVEERQATIADLKSTVAQQRRNFEAAIARERKQSEATDGQQQKEIQALTASLTEQAAQIQKVSAQLEASKPAPQMVLNNQ